MDDELPELRRVVTREDVKAYADASGDRNPLHQRDEVARAAGFENVTLLEEPSDPIRAPSGAHAKSVTGDTELVKRRRGPPAAGCIQSWAMPPVVPSPDSHAS